MKFASASVALMLVASPLPAQTADEPGEDPREAYVPANVNADGEKVVAGLNRFGFDLYSVLRGDRGDLAVSPASVSTAFGLAYAGARGQTAREIQLILHYPAGSNFHASFGALLKTMDLHQNGRTLTVNNAVWLQRGLKASPDYLDLVQRNYGAGLQWADYKTDPNDARSQINGWIESKTNHKIRKMLGPLDVTKETRSLLVNTVYFKADWSEPFDKDYTKDRKFTLESGQETVRPLMLQKNTYQFAAVPGVKVLAIPYRGQETEMVLFLPDQPEGLAKLERSLSSASVRRWLAKLDVGRSDVIVTLPKFRIEKRYSLVPTLKSMGMRAAFSDRSDFSGMKLVDPQSPDRKETNLKIDTVVHQVFVEVEESGTEAAAATAIGSIVITGAVRRPPKIFCADHPFLFMIRDRRTNAILFIGRYTGENA